MPLGPEGNLARGQGDFFIKKKRKKEKEEKKKKRKEKRKKKKEKRKKEKEKKKKMNPMGYSRLEESERRLFGIPVKDMVDFPLVTGAYRYNESVIVVYATGVHRCLEVWGNDDRTTTVGMVAGTSTPPHTWMSSTSPANERFQFDAPSCCTIGRR